MRSVHAWLEEYGESHRNPVNKALHWLCVPVIYWTILALLWSLPTPWATTLGPVPVNWAVLAFVLAQGYYFALSPALGAGLLVINLLLLGFTAWLEPRLGAPLWQVAAVAFVLAWIGQFVGHLVEGKRPSFFKDLQFLLIGPAWLLGHCYRRLGVAF